MSASVEDRLARLEAIEELKQLKARYLRLLDGELWDEFRALFTDDARFSFPGGKFEDLDADGFVTSVKAGYVGAAARSVHHGHTPEIELAGPDEARAIWAMFDWVDRYVEGDDSHRVAYQGFGYYHEEYRRSRAGWLISSIRLTRLRVDSVPPINGLEPPPVR